MRSHLDLQINLLSERKIAKLIHLPLRVDPPMVRNRQDATAEAMQSATDTRAIVEAIANVNRDTPSGNDEIESAAGSR